MKRLLVIILLICTNAWSADNAIKMGYNFTTVSQTVVFDNTMRAGGTLALSALAMDGGGRAPGDPFTLKLVFYNSNNAIITTVQQATTLTYGVNTPYANTVTATNCGGSCTNVAYVSVQFYGKDGGYWAGNYGPYIISPTLTFNGGTNILYNPEFGVYGTNGYAQGWASTAGWQNCALYSGAATCVINNGATVNGGTYSASGGTTSAAPGGYTAAPTLCCGGSSASFSASQTNLNKITTYQARTSDDNKVYIEQIGNSNTVTIDQSGTKNNYAKYTGYGDSNTVTINQSGNNSTQTNYTDLTINGNSNRASITQTSTGGTKGAFVSISDNNNNVTILQKDSGSDYLNLNLSGGAKTVDITQQGAGNHMADITLTGAGARSLSLTQQGSTQQFYSISSTCASSCQAITVTQGN